MRLDLDMTSFLPCKKICTPESYNKDISYQLFDYKITSVNSQCENTNSKGDFVLKKRFEMFILKITKFNLTQIWYDEFN